MMLWGYSMNANLIVCDYRTEKIGGISPVTRIKHCSFNGLIHCLVFFSKGFIKKYPIILNSFDSGHR